MNDNQYNQEIDKFELGRDYQQFLNTKVGRDIYNFLNREFEQAQNDIVLEPHQRVAQTGTDTLRGRLQILSKFYNHVNARILDSHRASESIAKHNKNS